MTRTCCVHVWAIFENLIRTDLEQPKSENKKLAFYWVQVGPMLQCKHIQLGPEVGPSGSEPVEVGPTHLGKNSEAAHRTIIRNPSFASFVIFCSFPRDSIRAVSESKTRRRIPVDHPSDSRRRPVDHRVLRVVGAFIDAKLRSLLQALF